jgi:tRNA-Thr(GGU) m(6)t(6)A37 methyltransferase TsaA
MVQPDAAIPDAVLTLTPIGVVRTGLGERVAAPRQPAAAAGIAGTIELSPGRHFEDALADLDGFDRIWVLFWFDRNPGWRPKVLPPRSTTGRKGVFATRSPHRPNPLGLSVLRLERIDGLTLHVLDVDMLDGTPVLDIKPYVPYTDAWPDARSGWLATPARAAVPVADPVPAWQVTFSVQAAAQADWVAARTGLPLRERIATTLAMGPQPHAYRRIRRAGDGWQLAVRDWRASFRVTGRCIEVLAVTSGYRAAALAAGSSAEHELHREFLATWPAAHG